MNEREKLFVRVVDSDAFVEACRTAPVLRAMVQMYKHYIIKSNGIAMVDFRITLSEFAFIVESRKEARGYLTWDSFVRVDEPALKSWVSISGERQREGASMSIDDAHRLGDSLWRISSLLLHMRGVVPIVLGDMSATEKADAMVVACNTWRRLEEKFQ